VAIIQAAPNVRGQAQNQLLAVGLKTFVPLTGLATIFRRSALWALVIPSSRPEPTRTFLAQKILWQLQLGVCVAHGWGASVTESDKKNVQMERTFSKQIYFFQFIFCILLIN